MKKALRALVALGVLGMGITFLNPRRSFAGTPQENGQSPFQVAPFSGATILTSTASTTGTATLTLTISTPTAINSGGATFSGRNCFTRFVVQMATYTVLTVKDNNTTPWTIYGSGIGTTGTNTITLPEDHLGPFCTAIGDQTQFILTPTAGLTANAESINVEGYTTYGGTNNAGPMY